MKVGIKTTEENYRYYVLRRTIVICWTVLAVCLVIKLLGGNYFCIVCNNSRVISVVTWIDTHFVGKLLLGIISSAVSYTFFYLAIMQKKMFTIRQAVFVYSSVAVFSAIRIAFQNASLIGIVFDTVQFFIIPLVLCRKEPFRWVIPRIIVGITLLVLFQVMSMLIKDLSLREYTTENTLTACIFMIDVYIMLCLYYLYSNNKHRRRRTTKMGMWMSWLFGKSEAQLENMKERKKRRIAKLRAEIAEIEKALAMERAASENNDTE